MPNFFIVTCQMLIIIWFDRIHAEGLIEFEAAHTRTRFSNPAQADQEENDLELATVELAVGIYR